MRKWTISTVILFLTIFISVNIVLPINAQDIPDTWPTKPANSEIKAQIGQVQIPFIKNEGQINNDQVKYYAETFAGMVMVEEEGLFYLLSTGENKYPQIMVEKFNQGKPKLITGQVPATTKVNYYKGNDVSSWQQNLSTYDVVSLGEVYENIEVKLKAYGNNIEKLFLIGPGGSPKQISMELEGIEALSIGDAGQLVIQTRNGSLAMTAPIAYQEIKGEQIPVNVAYWVSGNQYGFEVGEYDPTHELVIDPMLASSLFGGAEADNLTAMAVDNSGNVYVTGYTNSLDMLENAKKAFTRGNNFEWDPWSYQDPDPNNVSNPQDVFVAKLNPNLTSLLAATYIGGSENDRANSITLGSDGSIYVGGVTFSSGIRTYRDYMEYDEYEYYDPWDYMWDYDVITFEIGDPIAFPTTDGAYQTRFSGTDENTDYIDSKYSSFFISKLDANLNLKVSTLLGEGIAGNDGINGIAFDSAGNIVVAGKTESANYPTTTGAYDETYNNEKGNAFVSKLDGDLANLLASTYLGGGGGKYEGTATTLNGTWANDIALDTSGNIYITGETTDKNFHIVGGYQDQLNRTGSGSSSDAFVAKFNANLTELLASTYLGGDGSDVGIALAVDGSNVFVTGNTTSNDFPITEGAYQEARAANGSYYDIFLAKLNNNLNQLLGGTYLGGSQRDDVFDIAINTDNVYVTGTTASSNFPTTDGSEGKVLISKLNKDLTTLRASTLLGDNGTSQSIVVKGGKTYIAGNTNGSYPVTDGTYNKTGRNGDVFITILADNLTHARITQVTTEYKFNNQSFGLGTEIPIQVNFNANVIVEGEGIPKLKLNASEDAVAIYSQGSGTSTLEFLYTVQLGDKADILNYLDRDSIVLENCAILDMGLDAADLKLPDPNASNALGYRKIKINTMAPTIVKVSSPIADGTYGAGYEIPIEITFTEKVKAEGTPYLLLNIEPEGKAYYASGSGTNTLTFIYKVQREDSILKLNYKDTNSLKIDEKGNIRDLIENVADLTLPEIDSEMSLAGQKNIVIDNNAPYILNVTSSLEDGTYSEGQIVPIKITFSEAVNVTNTPRLALNTTPERYANYKSGSGTEVLTFEYIVGNSDNTLQGETPIKLNYSGKDALILRFGELTGTITGVINGNNAILTLPNLSSPYSLGGSKNIFIDNTPPKYKSLTLDEKTSTTYGAGTTLHINLTFSEVVFVEGTPYLELNTSPARNATYLSGSGTDTLKFAYTIMEGDGTTAELDYKGANALKLEESSSIKDAAGHDAELNLAWSSSWISTGGDLKKRAIKIDTIKPFWEADSTLEATNVTANNLKLTWSKTAKDNVKIDAYNIYQDNILIGTVTGTVFTDPATTYNVTGLSAETEYTFRIEALDAAGNESIDGPIVTVTTEETTGAEDTEAPVWQDESTLKANEVGIHHVILSWNNGDVYDNVAVTGFKVYQGDELIANIDANTTSYKVTGLTSYTKYTFAIQAIDAAGNESTDGPVLEITTKIPDLIIYGSKVSRELEYTMNDLINLESDENFPPESETTPIIRQKYSSVNDYGTRKNYGAEGVRISYLLEEAGVDPGYGMIVFYPTDSSPILLREDQINEARYYFSATGDPISVEPILAFQSTDSTQGEPNFGNMTMHYPRLFFGQKMAGEVTNSYFLKNIFKIVIGDATDKKDEEAPTWSVDSKLEVSNITDTSIIISWPEAQDNVGVTEYRIFQDNELIMTVSALASFYKVTDLSANTKYTFKVEAGDAAGNWSSDGPSIIVTTKEKPPVKDTEPPVWESGILEASNITSTGLTLTWAGANDNVAVTHYNIYQDDELITTVDATLDSYSVTNLNPYTEYTFKVEAGDAAGNLSNNGPSIEVSTLSIPPAKISLNLSKTSGIVGEIITASGMGEPNHWIVIRVIENKEDIVVFDTIKSDDKGNYSCTFKIPNVSPGNLIVIVGYEKEVAIANLTVRETSIGGGGGTTPPKTETPPSSVPTISQEVNPGVGATISLNNEVKVVIPPNALNETKPIKVSIQKVETAPPAPSDAKLISEVYEFSIENQKSYTFASKIVITLPFDVSSIAPNEEPAIFYYDEERQEWINLGGQVSGNSITVNVDHFTKFAVFGVKKVSKPEILSDINEHWAKDNIMQLITTNAISGYPDGSFKPNNSITRAEFVTILVKAFNLKSNNSKVFSDTSYHWAKDYISIAASLDIVSGYNAEQFGADDLITREQMAVMVVKAAKLPLASEELSFIDQATIASWANDYVATAVQNDIMKGYPDNSVKPQGYATRAEAVTVIVNALK